MRRRIARLRQLCLLHRQQRRGQAAGAINAELASAYAAAIDSHTSCSREIDGQAIGFDFADGD